MEFIEEFDLYSNKELEKIFKSNMRRSEEAYWTALVFSSTKPDKYKNLSSKQLNVRLKKISTFAKFISTINLDNHGRATMCSIANIAKHMWLLADKYEASPNIKHECLRLNNQFVQALDRTGGLSVLVETVINELSSASVSEDKMPLTLDSAISFMQLVIRNNFKEFPEKSFMDDIRELRSIGQDKHTKDSEILISMVSLCFYNTHIQPRLKNEKADDLERTAAACLEVFLKFQHIPSDVEHQCSLMSLLATVDIYLDRVLDSEYTIYKTNPRDLFEDLKQKLGTTLYGDGFDRVWHTGKTLNCLEQMDYLKASLCNKSQIPSPIQEMPLF